MGEGATSARGLGLAKAANAARNPIRFEPASIPASIVRSPWRAFIAVPAGGRWKAWKIPPRCAERPRACGIPSAQEQIVISVRSGCALIPRAVAPAVRRGRPRRHRLEQRRRSSGAAPHGSWRELDVRGRLRGDTAAAKIPVVARRRKQPFERLFGSTSARTSRGSAAHHATRIAAAPVCATGIWRQFSLHDLTQARRGAEKRRVLGICSWSSAPLLTC